ncbi:MAG: PAS domain-containing protein [Minwuia sp.]|nr:PAS domain-containing protein [Minwuia sp.]
MFDRSHLGAEHLSLLDYWQGLGGTKGIPSRSAVNPMDVPRLLKNIGLIDVVTDIAGLTRFRYRLIGTRINHIYGSDFTNRWVHESKTGAHGEFVAQLYLDAVTRAVPVFSRTMITYGDQRELQTDRLVLPLSGDGKTVDMLLFSNLFRSENLTFGLKPFRFEDIAEVEESLRIAA